MAAVHSPRIAREARTAHQLNSASSNVAPSTRQTVPQGSD